MLRFQNIANIIWTDSMLEIFSCGLKFSFRSIYPVGNDHHNNKASSIMLLLCVIHACCTLPHMIYTFSGTYGSAQDHVYDILLGWAWFPYGCNIIIYAAQRDQYWNAYKSFIQEKILPKKRLSQLP